MTCVRVRGLTQQYPGRDDPALAELDLTIESGSTTAVLGVSGSGKSTFLRLVAGLDRPTCGTVSFDGRDVTEVPAEARGVAMMLQRPLLFPHLTVIDNVAFAARASGLSRAESRRRGHRYLDVVQLAHLSSEKVRTLSGGQAQRVALARALAAQPSVLLLDEPFSALDTVLREEMYDLLESVRAELNPTILLVTHDQAEAARLADRIAVIVDGRLAHHSDVATAYLRPSTLAVHRLMGGLTEVPGIVTGGVHTSALGAHPTNLPDGPATAVLRHESVHLRRSGPGLRGTITAVRAVGMRRRVSVALGDAAVAGESVAGSAAMVVADVAGPGVGEVGETVMIDLSEAAVHTIRTTPP